MQFDFDSMRPAERYFLLTQSVLPRPIAWVLTENQAGQFNLAPYSFFAPVCSNPATLVVSMGHRPDGNEKDSYANLKRTGKCVVHIPSFKSVDAVNNSSASLPPDVSEIDQLEMALEPFLDHGLPRLACADIAFACEYQQQVDLGPGNQHVVFLTVTHMYASDGCIEQDVKGRMQLDPKAIDPLARLGATEYAALGEFVSRNRPE